MRDRRGEGEREDGAIDLADLAALEGREAEEELVGDHAKGPPVGGRLVAAQLLILAGAYVESGVIVHRASRELLHGWARSELATEAGFHTFMMGLTRGRSDVDTPCELSKAYVDGVPQLIASYLARRTPQELRHLVRAAWVWQDEVEDEAYRAETHAFPRQAYCIDVF